MIFNLDGFFPRQSIRTGDIFLLTSISFHQEAISPEKYFSYVYVYGELRLDIFHNMLVATPTLRRIRRLGFCGGERVGEDYVRQTVAGLGNVSITHMQYDLLNRRVSFYQGRNLAFDCSA